MANFQTDLVSILSARERSVAELVAVGLTSKQVGGALKISPRTVEVYRARAMAKLRVRNQAELIRVMLEYRAASDRPA